MIKIGRSGVPRMKPRETGTRDFNFKCKSVNRWRPREGGGTKVPAIVLVRTYAHFYGYRPPVSSRAANSLSRLLRDAASLVCCRENAICDAHAITANFPCRLVVISSGADRARKIGLSFNS